MGRIFRIVINGYPGRPLPPDLPLAEMIDKSLRGFVVRPLDLQLQAVTGGKRNPVGADFNVKLVNRIRD